MTSLGPFRPGFNDRQQSHQHVLFLNTEFRPCIKDISPRPRRNTFFKEEGPRCRDAAFFTRCNIGITHERVPASLFKVIHRKKRRNACNTGWIATPKRRAFLLRSWQGCCGWDALNRARRRDRLWRSRPDDLARHLSRLFTSKLLKAHRRGPFPLLRRGKRTTSFGGRASASTPLFNDRNDKRRNILPVERIDLCGKRRIIQPQAFPLLSRKRGRDSLLKKTLQRFTHGFHLIGHGNIPH